jgi:hypothetical protein
VGPAEGTIPLKNSGSQNGHGKRNPILSLANQPEVRKTTDV